MTTTFSSNFGVWGDLTPARTSQTLKKIWQPESGEFVTVLFVRVHTRTRKDLDQAVKWHRDNYGAPVYLGNWWHDDHSVWLRESLATFWLLQQS